MKNKMLKLSFTLAALFVLSTCYSQKPVEPVKSINSTLQFLNDDFNMGNIKSGMPLEYNVTVKNISNDTLSLQSVRAGCGCTTPKYKIGVINPGETSVITLGFNGSAVGQFVKYADIFFGNGMIKKIKFSGNAIKD